jgi:hypothetical protein
MTWKEFDHETQAFGLATPGGLISSTGIAGFTACIRSFMPRTKVTTRDDAAEGLLSAVQATRFAAIIFFFVQGSTGLSILLHGNLRAVAQWVATLSFVLAWADLSKGTNVHPSS